MTMLTQKQDMDTRLPIYQRLKDLFTQKVQSGQWGGADAIPSEYELSVQYGVAPGTVRKAIESLVSDGYLTRQQGKGTFVRQASFGNAMFRFFRHTDPDGHVIQPAARILSIKTAIPTQTEIKKLLLIPNERVIHLTRVRYAQNKNEPLLYEEISVSAQRFEALLSADTNSFEDLLYPAYDRLCQVRVHRATETISFGLAELGVAKRLLAEVNAPVAIITRLATAIDGQPVEWRKSYGLASRFSYSIELR
jgi:GntR family transcriptional regulator